MKTELEKMSQASFTMRRHRTMLHAQQSSSVTRQFNATTEEERDLRTTILQELFASVGSAFVEPPFHCDYGYIHVGKNFYMNFNHHPWLRHC